MAAFFASLCSCFPSHSRKEEKESDYSSQPHLDDQSSQPSHPSSYNRYQPFVDENDPYHSSQPLPRYTARPISIREKTLAISGRRSLCERDHPRDEKNQNIYDRRSPSNNADNAAEDDSSDASSQISFPTSIGNTSTATGETPPPPYSSYCSSRAHSQRSMSISIPTNYTGTTETDSSSIIPPSPIATPPPVFCRDHTGTSRRSYDGAGKRDDSTLPEYERS
ncbi:conserved hypothetical protein [Trichophyton verrucosum HKI 0517]|uniref:Uncharacterized protein n=1 Tax=Trichophyton verrucosum (strain HKI 0517) TaxID=663202 RepID=D4D545_TRIVH|nr:uncharacterized protein TRV_02215 [Trichophyton verrucosum HKI 0517]EFE43022.1 conserved hypothetical protein [Trichophyton verrucosum HKI 0517]